VASISGNNRIVLRAAETGHWEEGTLSGAASPGMNLVLRQTASSYERHYYSAGGSDYVGTGTEVSVTAGNLKIVIENSVEGLTVDDAYADGDDVHFFLPKSGDVLQVLVASGQTVVKGTGGAAGTDGTFVTDAANPVVEFLESSAGSPSALAADTLVRARVI
jgi:hypothetical protein